MLIGQMNHERHGGTKWLKRRAGQSPSRLPRDVENDYLDQSTLIALQSHVSFNLQKELTEMIAYLYTRRTKV